MYYHTRLDRKMRFAAPATFMANSKSTVDEAFPGDVIGLYDNGSLKIGDTPVFMADSEWILKIVGENYPSVKFHTTSESHLPETSN